MASRRLFTRALGLALALVGTSCGEGLRRFPLDDPLWFDPDMFTFAPPPEEYWSPFAWDAANHTLFRPVSRFFAVDPAGEAINVNALDEVPNSSWFTNRLGRYGMTPAEIERGACSAPLLEPTGKWVIAGAKPDGANPGFQIEAADGRRYLLKFDGTLQGERATIADVLGSRIYHAVGYWAPCNSVVFFERDILELDPETTYENEKGEDVPLTWKEVELVLSKSYRLPDGRYRASASLFLPGKPLGPWTYQGIREDDPNDVIPHEDRRELRGGYVLASWINHFDTREQNSLSVWMENESGLGYVRHYYLDFGDSLGSLWEQEGISRRLGHAYYLDVPYLVEDALTLGLIRRPWEDPEFGPTGPVLGYFGSERFVPDEYRTGYPNPAFIRASERDNAWMARILARFDLPRLKAALAPARVHDDLTAREIIRILMERRHKLLSRWLQELSPLSWPQVRPMPGGDGADARLCLEDLALVAGVVRAESRSYRAHAFGGDDLAPLPVGSPRATGRHHVCLALPRVPGAAPATPAYLIVDVIARTDTYAAIAPARVHLYDRGGAYVVVGLERPYEAAPPSR